MPTTTRSSRELTLEALDSAVRCARRYVEVVPDRSVAPTSSALGDLSKFHESFPAHGAEATEIVAMLDKLGSPATVASTGRRYFGFVIGGSVPAAMAASWLVSVWDQNAAMRAMSPVAAELEEVVLAWVCEALHLPAGCSGGLVTSATMANLTGIVAARYSLLANAGWNVNDDGMFGAPPIDVVVGEEIHSLTLKALALAGFGKKRVKVVDVDGQGRIRADKFPKVTDRTIVLLQAGNVNTGAFDPAHEICPRAKADGAWVHVDGAFGLWAAASPKYRHLTRGFELADSWGTDAHKWPNAGYDSGIAIVRDGNALRSAMSSTAAYLDPSARREPMYHTPDSSRRARGVELWATLKSLGKSGLSDLIERTCAHAQKFASGLRDAGYEILNDVVINQVLVSFGTPEQTREVMRRVQEDGTCWCGGTVWQGKTAMRISVSSWATTDADVEQSLSAMIRIAREVCSGS
ncbi:MAG: aspartate aminotransferase family protein [Acidobacteria bacterium]|nr:aspartate aminotransferase family protein [Acidobacteriota bacterium]